MSLQSIQFLRKYLKMIDLTETRLGIALIVEGKTDKLFYKQVIAHYVAISGCALHEEIDGDSLEEIFYVLDAQEKVGQ